MRMPASCLMPSPTMVSVTLRVPRSRVSGVERRNLVTDLDVLDGLGRTVGHQRPGFGYEGVRPTRSRDEVVAVPGCGS